MRNAGGECVKAVKLVKLVKRAPQRPLLSLRNGCCRRAQQRQRLMSRQHIRGAGGDGIDAGLRSSLRAPQQPLLSPAAGSAGSATAAFAAKSAGSAAAAGGSPCR